MEIGDLCAVYGSLRAGFGNHWGRLDDAERLEDGIIRDQFRMISCGGFPGLLKSGEPTDIVVEIYKIDTENRVHRLDALEGYPSFYNREVVELVDGRKCWVYFLEHSRYATYPPVASGDWKERD